MTRTQRPRVVFLFGPTAVGKTELLSNLPKDTFEIVSADSLQVYRRLDIGTAKPSPEFRSRLPHHLIDILDPTEQFDVGSFVGLAEEAIADIGARGRIPLVSGGAGFYLRHLLYGLPPAPASSPDIRSRVKERLGKRGLAELYRELRAVDPESASRIGQSDEYRITRALEVYEATGKPLSAFPRATEPRQDLDIALVELVRPRQQLHERIGRRVEQMMRRGLRAEVERLLADGYAADCPGMRGIGYREFFGESGLRSGMEDHEIALEIGADTRRYAKKQTTFFRGLPNVQAVDADRTDRVLGIIHAHAGRPLA